MEYKTFHDWILKNIPEGSKMLEFGSGEGTKRFTAKFDVTSIEHDLKFVGLDPKSNYIHAPIVNGWYDISKFKGLKDRKFDVILIDGPTGVIGRHGLLSNFSLFDWNAIIVVDDINRPKEHEIFKQLWRRLGMAKRLVFQGKDRKFGVILNVRE